MHLFILRLGRLLSLDVSGRASCRHAAIRIISVTLRRRSWSRWPATWPRRRAPINVWHTMPSHWAALICGWRPSGRRCSSSVTAITISKLVMLATWAQLQVVVGELQLWATALAIKIYTLGWAPQLEAFPVAQPLGSCPSKNTSRLLNRIENKM